MLILVIKTEGKVKNFDNAVGSGFFRDINDEAGRLVREKQKEIDMDEMMNDMYDGTVDGKDKLPSGVEVHTDPVNNGDLVGIRKQASSVELIGNFFFCI